MLLQMDVEHLERLLVQLEASQGNLARYHKELQAYAGWCVDRILALGGAGADKTEKERLMTAQMRTRSLLLRANGEMRHPP